MKFVVDHDVLVHFESHAANSFMSKPNKDGYFRFFNKNNFTTYYYKIVGQCINKRAWVVERSRNAKGWNFPTHDGEDYLKSTFKGFEYGRKGMIGLL